jgi:hypothetical protein
MMRAAAAAGAALALMLGPARSCEPTGAEGGKAGGPPMARAASHPITFLASWKAGFWVDVTLIIDGEARGPFERRDGSFKRTIDVPAEAKAEIVLRPHEDPPPGVTVCSVSWFTTMLPPNGYEHRQDGKCHAWGYVPKVETQG